MPKRGFAGDQPQFPTLADDESNQTYQLAADFEDNFTFQFPQKFVVNSLPLEGGGRRLLVKSNEPKKGFEVTILSFDEPGPLTAGRIRLDLPSMPMDNLRTLTLAPTGRGG